jgi:hypothetical protein
VSWFISNLQEGIVTRTPRREVVQLRAILTLPNRLTRADDDTIGPRESKFMDKQEPLELIPNFLGETRHEFVAKLAYQYWEKRGRPFGSPEADWFRAERAVYSSLLALGLITQSANDVRNMAEKIYR